MKNLTLEEVSLRNNQAKEYANQCREQIKRIVSPEEGKEIPIENDGNMVYALVDGGTEELSVYEAPIKAVRVDDGKLMLVTTDDEEIHEGTVVYETSVWGFVLEALLKREGKRNSYRELVMDGFAICKEAREKVLEILTEHGEQSFEWDEGEAPSIISSNLTDDVCDCYVKRMWVQDGKVFADLHGCYNEIEAENVNLTEDEANVDWLDVLDWLVDWVL